MSLAIDADDVTGVLLRGYAQWFMVALDEAGKSTFGWDTWEVRWAVGGPNAARGEHTLLSVGERAGLAPTAIAWQDNAGHRYAASVSDLLALRYRQRPPD